MSGMKLFLAYVLSLTLLIVVCASSTTAQPQELRVLFIGNSLTYSNDLPAIVAALAESSQQKRFIYKTIAVPNFSLEDHWNLGDAQKAIAKDKWDVVVLQQGPSGLPESRQSLLEYTRRFAQAIRAVGAKPALYQVGVCDVRKIVWEIAAGLACHVEVAVKDTGEN